MDETKKPLTQKSTDEMLDLLFEASPVITGFIEKAKQDEELKALLKDMKPNISNQELAIKVIPVILKKQYRSDIYSIIGIFTGKSAEQIASQTLKETLVDLKSLLANEDLINFTKSIT